MSWIKLTGWAGGKPIVINTDCIEGYEDSDESRGRRIYCAGGRSTESYLVTETIDQIARLIGMEVLAIGHASNTIMRWHKDGRISNV